MAPPDRYSCAVRLATSTVNASSSSLFDTTWFSCQRRVLACLIAFNIASTLRWQENQVVSNSELLLALTVDVDSLTAQLYLSGGATNPFVFLYLLHVILGAVLLETWST